MTDRGPESGQTTEVTQTARNPQPRSPKLAPSSSTSSTGEVSAAAKPQVKGRVATGVRGGPQDARRRYSLPDGSIIELDLVDPRARYGLAPRPWQGQPEVYDPRLNAWLESKRPKAKFDQPSVFPAGQRRKSSILQLALEANRGFSKSAASRLIKRVAATSALPMSQVRAELIPDSSWKRAGKVLGPQASQTVARLSHILSVAERIWGSEKDAAEWLNIPHPELQGATPLSLVRTEAGGRAVEALLGALEFGFPV
jgi:putative toxin-antitoxin system antitoxin component (TIGR02293 family)